MADSEAAQGRLRARALWVCAALGLAAGLYGRIVPAWDLVMSGSDEPVKLLDTDSYYHLRHTWFSVQHFPLVQRWDVGTHYPLGERSPHAGLFNQVFAAVALLIGGADVSLRTVSQVLAWAPVALHTLAMITLFALARRAAGLASATLAVWVLTLFPGLEQPRTFLGFADHHAAEVWLLLASAWGLFAALEHHGSSPPAGDWRSWNGVRAHLWRARFALPLLIFQFTWSGAPLVIAYLAACLALVALVDVLRDFDVSVTARTCRDFGVALASGMSLVALIHPDAVMIRELLVPTVAGSAALAAFGFGLLWLLPPGYARARGRGAALGVVLVMAGLGYLVLALVPADYLELLLSPKSEAVSEQQAVSLLGFLRLQGVPGVLGVLAPVALLWPALRSRNERSRFALACLATLSTLHWLMIRDYGYGPPLLLALSCALLTRLLPARLGGWLPGIALLGSALQIWPAALAHNPFASVPTPLLKIHRGWHEAMSWLRRNSPSPELSVDRAVAPWLPGRSPFPDDSYGVLSTWEFGNFVAALGQRTPLRSHGMSKQPERWLLAADERASIEQSCPACAGAQRVRYVVLSAPTLAEHFITIARSAGLDDSVFLGELGQAELDGGVVPLRGYGDVYAQTMAARLYLDDANGLSRYRLVYAAETQALLSYRTTRPSTEPAEGSSFIRVSAVLETPEQRALADQWLAQPERLVSTDQGLLYAHELLSSVKIFELVPGARLRGSTWPSAKLTLFLGLKVTTTGRELVYRQSAQADANGRFELLMPYSSAGGSDVVSAVAPIQLLAAAPDGQQRVVSFRVTEQAVQQSELLSLGDLGAAPPGSEPISPAPAPAR